MLTNHPIFVVLAVAVVAPLLAEIPIGVRVPVVVLEVVLGILIGPSGLGLLQPGPFLSTMIRVGMGATLFMAGMEIDFERVRGRPLWLALRAWVVSVGLAFLAVAALDLVPAMNAPMMVTLALSTTGLGALLPILRDGGQLETSFGRHLVAAGTIGEVGPIVVVSLALSDRYSTIQEFGFLLLLLALVGVAIGVGVGSRPPRLLALLRRTLEASTQLPVRLAMLVMAALGVVSIEFGFEGILGSFVAGMIVGLVARGEEARTFRTKIDAICFGWLTPFFFVGTGAEFDLGALTRDAKTMLLAPAFLALLLLTRGAPVFLYRDDIPRPERLPFALSSSVASLSLIVVIAQIGLRARNLDPDISQALVGAALMSLLLYPTLAAALLSRARGPVPEPSRTA